MKATSDEGGFHAPSPQMHAVYVASPCSRSPSRRRPASRRRRRDGVEPHRAEPDDPAPADGARGDAAAWRWSPERSVRRGQRDRPRPRAVPPRPRRRRRPAVGVSQDAAAATAATTCSSRSRPTPSTLRSTRRGTPRSTESHPTARPDPGRRRPRREAAAAAMLAFREDDGFLAPFDFTLVIGPDAGDWRPVTPTALDPDAWVGNAEAVPDREPVAVPLGRAERADERRVREGLQRGEGARRAEQHDADGGRDGGGGLLAVPADRALERPRPRPRAPEPLRPRHGRRGASLRDDQPRRGGRRDRLLERQVLLALLAAASGDPGGGHRRNPATIADPTWESLFAPATQTTPPLATPPFPDHPVGHGCVSGAVAQRVPGLLRDRQGRVRRRSEDGRSTAC